MKDIEELFYIVAVKDELTNTFLQPTFGDNLDGLKRIFTSQINNLPIWKDNPSDFSLYMIGRFDQETGTIIPQLEKLLSGHTVRRKESE